MKAYSGYIPPAVQQKADKAEEALGRPAIVRRHHSWWQIIVEDGRVKLTYEFKMSSPQKLNERYRTLRIDGRIHYVTGGMDEIVQLFDDPDYLKPVTLEPLENVCPIEDAPPELQHDYYAIARRLPDTGMELHVATYSGGWILAIVFERGELRAHYEPNNHRSWALRERRAYLAVRDGKDYSPKIVGSLIEAFLALLDINVQPVQTATPPIKSPAGPAVRPTSVQVRNTTVIRN